MTIINILLFALCNVRCLRQIIIKQIDFMNHINYIFLGGLVNFLGNCPYLLFHALVNWSYFNGLVNDNTAGSSAKQTNIVQTAAFIVTITDIEIAKQIANAVNDHNTMVSIE
eukprot:539481_1